MLNVTPAISMYNSFNTVRLTFHTTQCMIKWNSKGLNGVYIEWNLLNFTLFICLSMNGCSFASSANHCIISVDHLVKGELNVDEGDSIKIYSTYNPLNTVR